MYGNASRCHKMSERTWELLSYFLNITSKLFFYFIVTIRILMILHWFLQVHNHLLMNSLFVLLSKSILRTFKRLILCHIIPITDNVDQTLKVWGHQASKHSWFDFALLRLAEHLYSTFLLRSYLLSITHEDKIWTTFNGWSQSTRFHLMLSAKRFVCDLK